MKARFFLRFSYIGTYFRGAEKQWMKQACDEADPASIQGVMEIALSRLRTLHRPKLVLSSRTDSGVHALNTTAHVDIESVGRNIHKPEFVGKILNSYFNKYTLGITVNEVKHVPLSFHARHCALSRTYVYRLATLKKDAELPDCPNHHVVYPMEEWKRCYFIRDPNFDIEKFKEGLKYLPGLHDWSSFMKFTGSQKPHQHNRRTLYSVELRRGQSLVPLTLRRKRPDLFDYWEIEFIGKGFVHNQIRRIIGVLYAVALDRVPVEEIKVMLQVPSKHTWPSRAHCVPPHGLYLTDIEYDPKVFEFGEHNEEKILQDDEEFDRE